MNAHVILRKLVDLAGGPAETGYVLALDGDGLEHVPSELKTDKGTYSVHRPNTELALRRLAWKSGGAPFVALVDRDLAMRLPPDLVRRARGGRVHALELNDILGLVLGVRVVGTESERVQQLALDHIEDLHRVLHQRTLPTVIDRELLDELLLEVTVGRRVREAEAAQLLADWLQTSVAWDEPIRDLVSRNLPALKGAEGRILSWGLNDVKRLELIVVRGALLAVEADEVPQALWGSLWELQDDPTIGLPVDVLRKRLVHLATEALDALGNASGPYLKSAETLARQFLAPSDLERHPLLPLGLRNRAAALAQAAAEGKAIPAQDVAWLKHHRAAPYHEAEIRVLREMGRLSRFVKASEEADGGDLVAHVRSYQRSGSFADLAATRLRRALAASAHYHAEAEKVLERYRALRNEQNRRFAETLSKGYQKALHSRDLCPLHRMWKRVVMPGLQKSEGSEGLYVVVLDGCSYPVFLDLLYALAQDHALPIGLPFAEGDDSAQGAAGLAPLPTVTSHARGAIFLGELPKDPLVPEAVWRDEQEGATDPKRFKQNQALGDRTRKLFLKGDLTDGGGGLLEALKDPGTEVVAAVFNAVDDQIGSSNTGAPVQLEPKLITGFLPSLREAFQRGRQVLLTADHGHSPFIDKSRRVGKGSTPRYMPLDEGALVPEGFIEVELDGLGGEPGRKAFAWEMGVYRGSQQVAFHGGCSLEEMVVPMAWLVREGVPADEPAWWYGQRRAEDEAQVEEKPRKRSGARKRKPTKVEEARERGQFALFDAKPSRAARAAKIGEVGISDPVVAELNDAQRAALVLLAENGEARATELGKAIGKAPGRVSGFMAQLGRILHRSGVERFRIDELPGGEPRFVYVPPANREDA